MMTNYHLNVGTIPSSSLLRRKGRSPIVGFDGLYRVQALAGYGSVSALTPTGPVKGCAERARFELAIPAREAVLQTAALPLRYTSPYNSLLLPSCHGSALHSVRRDIIHQRRLHQRPIADVSTEKPENPEWNTAIDDARKKIAELKESIKIFAQMKKKGEPFPSYGVKNEDGG